MANWLYLNSARVKAGDFISNIHLYRQARRIKFSEFEKKKTNGEVFIGNMKEII